MDFVVRIIVSIVISFAVTFIASKVIIPVLRRKKAGQNVRDDGPQSHLVKQGTPTMGGIMMVIGIVVTVLCLSVYPDAPAGLTVVFLLVAMLGFTLIGFWDDIVKLLQKRSLGLRAWQKIVLQLVVAAVVAVLACIVLGSTQERIPFTTNTVEMGMGKIPFTMFVFIAMVNSVNLTDGLDGLATSLTLVNTLSYLAIILLGYPLLLTGAREMLHMVDLTNVAVFAAAVSGACIAFLCFNKYPAQVFMGDTGSFALGAAITVIAAALDFQIMIAITGFMFALSAVSVIIQVGSFKLRGKRVFKMAPLHHHFELKGVPETRVVLGYVIITVILCAMCVLGVGITGM
ncbi:phospho-N-acetylmuramoyl-pentapeptide-transferase [Christensenellaceae bacterium OttesenSCG-928-K19]|nr:phospho-N-acetylmuramoyl-pentapeptide-transferase [Christensenellaceae bacterium OttesenSCG-928-K19]